MHPFINPSMPASVQRTIINAFQGVIIYFKLLCPGRYLVYKSSVFEGLKTKICVTEQPNSVVHPFSNVWSRKFPKYFTHCVIRP